MRVGVPKELKDNEYRVAITPAGVRELVVGGHTVLIERGAGRGSSIYDDEFERAGAKILPDADATFAEAEMVLKVKEPVPEEFHRLRDGLLLFTYLHLAASEPVTRALVESGTTAVAYETVEFPDGSLPLLAPMSEVAGRMAPQAGAKLLEREHGGRGVLLGGVSGVRPGKVVVIGAGMAGMNAAWIAQGMEAEVVILDKNINKLRDVDRIHQGKILTLASNRLSVEETVLTADLVIGAVLMPGAVPHTSTYALTNATLPYVVELANRGLEEAVRDDPSLAKGVNVYRGEIVYEPVAEAHGLDYVPLDELI